MVFHSLSEVLKRISMADSLAQLTARAEAAENAVDGLARQLEALGKGEEGKLRMENQRLTAR